MVDHAQHDCRNSFAEKTATINSPYHFIDAGVPNVNLVGIKYRVCTVCGKQSADIPSARNLMMAIARTIVENDASLTGADIRFLRKRLGKKSADFARLVGVTKEQVSRWENDNNPPQHSADKLIRVLYCLESGDYELRRAFDSRIAEWLTAWAGEGQLSGIRAKLTDKEEWEAEALAA